MIVKPPPNPAAGLFWLFACLALFSWVVREVVRVLHFEWHMWRADVYANRASTYAVTHYGPMQSEWSSDPEYKRLIKRARYPARCAGFNNGYRSDE